MSEPLPSENDERFLLYAQIAEEIREQVRAGQQPDLEGLVQRHPQWAEQIRQLVPVLAVVGELGDPSSEIAPLVQLGEYRILREVGRGGMGVVYEAEQTSLRRRVALKVLPLVAALDARQLQRFKNEAHAAAQLHHSHIVPVYAVGCERGVHYYAMQFIDGHSLAEIIREMRRSQESGVRSQESGDRGRIGSTTGDRDAVSATVASPPDSWLLTPDSFSVIARLGVQAAEALEYAHRQGVIHRDIKPANLLVDTKGELWVTDFGLARTQNEAGLTLTGDLVGTIRYMSPEQAAAKRGLVDQRTDIYSLGATLYELLTLQPLCDGQTRLEVLRQITSDDTPTPRRRNRAIPPELETILVKALGKDPAERYATAQELADDLQRFLRHEPIRAKRPSLTEQARKWARRHRPVVWTAAGMLLLIAVGLGVSTALLYREQQKTRAAYEAEAEGRRLAKQAVDDMYTEVAEKWLKDQPRMQKVQRAFLEKALAFYEGFARQGGNDPNIRFEAGQAYRRVGNIRKQLGDLDGAEQAFREAVAVFQELADAHPPEAKYRQELAGGHYNLGLLLQQKGQMPAAEEAHQRALALRQQVEKEHPGGDRSSDVALSLEMLARFRREKGDAAEGRRLGEEALLYLEEAVKTDPANPKNRERIEAHCLNLAHTLSDLGEPQEAAKLVDRAIQVGEALVAEFPENADYRAKVAVAHYNRSYVLSDLNQPDAATKSLQRALAMQEQLVKDFPDVPGYQADAARTLSVLASEVIRTDELKAPRDQTALQAAARMLRQAIGYQEAVLRQSPRDVRHRMDLVIHRYNLAIVLQRLGDYRAAAQAVEDLPAVYPEAWQTYFRGATALAYCTLRVREDKRLAQAEREAVAKQYLSKSRAWVREAVRRGEDQPYANAEIARMLISLPAAELWDPEKAADLAKKWLARNPRSVVTWNTLAVACYRRGDWKGTLDALANNEKAPSGLSGYDLFFQAMAHGQLGNQEQARRDFEQGKAWRDKHRPGEGAEDLRRYQKEAAALLGVKEK